MTPDLIAERTGAPRVQAEILDDTWTLGRFMAFV